MKTEEEIKENLGKIEVQIENINAEIARIKPLPMIKLERKKEWLEAMSVLISNLYFELNYLTEYLLREKHKAYDFASCLSAIGVISNKINQMGDEALKEPHFLDFDEEEVKDE